MKKIFTFLAVVFLIGAFSASAQMFSVEKADNSSFSTEKEEWIHWDSGESTNGIGTGGAFVFAIASRWEPTDLAEYDGMQITKIQFVPRVAEATYTLKIWTGADAANEVYSQDISSVTIEEWNEIELSTAYTIDASEELWFGVHIDTPSGHPAGCDDGPAVGGKGNMIYSEADGWAPLTDLNAELDYNWSLQAFVTEGGAPQQYPVTFNVDMTGAVAGEVTFDPEVHDVYIAGSFPDWVEPGTDDQFMMVPAAPAKEDVVLYPETWEGSTPVLYTTEQGYVAGTNEYGDIGKGQVYEITEEYQITGGYFWFGAAEGSGSITYTVWDFDGTPGDVLGSVTADVSDITVSDDMAGAYYIAFDEPITVNSTFMIGIDMADIGSGVVGLYSNTDPEGTDKAWEQWSDGTWYGIFDTENSFGLAIDLAIFPTVAGNGGGDEMIYTITLDLEAGDYEYKYFIVESGSSSWDLGEWTAGDNRMVTITEATTINDIWGDPTNSVEDLVSENGMVVYPNPASTNVKVASDQVINEIRIFDIAGRMVYSNQIGEMNADISVDNFNRGMYFMQIFGENGVETHKIQILK